MKPGSLPQNKTSECPCVVSKYCPDSVRLELELVLLIFFETSFFWPLMWCTLLDWPLSSGQGALLHVQISCVYLIFIHPTHGKGQILWVFSSKSSFEAKEENLNINTNYTTVTGSAHPQC